MTSDNKHFFVETDGRKDGLRSSMERFKTEII